MPPKEGDRFSPPDQRLNRWAPLNLGSWFCNNIRVLDPVEDRLGLLVVTSQQERAGGSPCSFRDQEQPLFEHGVQVLTNPCRRMHAARSRPPCPANASLPAANVGQEVPDSRQSEGWLPTLPCSRTARTGGRKPQHQAVQVLPCGSVAHFPTVVECHRPQAPLDKPCLVRSQLSTSSGKSTPA